MSSQRNKISLVGKRRCKLQCLPENFDVTMCVLWSINGENYDLSFDSANGRPSRWALPRILVNIGIDQWMNSYKEDLKGLCQGCEKLWSDPRRCTEDEQMEKTNQGANWLTTVSLEMWPCQLC